MAVRQPLALNASGDWTCPGCESVVTAETERGTVNDISGRQVEADVDSFGFTHTDDCSVIAQIRRG